MNRIIFVLTVSIFAMLFLILFTNVKGLYAHEKHGRYTSEDYKGKVRYTTHIKPIFEQRCAKCHGAKSPEHMEFMSNIKKYKKKLKGPRMDNYTYMISFIVWPGTGSLMRMLDDGKNTEDGKPGKMYKRLGKTEEERQKNLKLFKEWVGYWTLNEWPALTKEEINKIKVIY